MNFKANWICAPKMSPDIVPLYRKSWKTKKPVKKAVLKISALGVYEAFLNGKRVGDFVLAPGWTVYEKRLQFQTYDVTKLLKADNELSVLVGRGWFSSPLAGWLTLDSKVNYPKGLIAELEISYKDGSSEVLKTDEKWTYEESRIRKSEIYDGETFDASFTASESFKAEKLDWSKSILIPQEGEKITEQDRVAVKEVIRTPKGETLLDFGQNLTGYLEFSVDAKAGDEIRILHGEVLDQEGNFYNENYRSAKAEINYICRDGRQTYHPQLTFYGFRYVKLDRFPGKVIPEDFTAIVVCSDLKRTGFLESGNAKLNQFFSNVFWGQRGNYLDVPTDCPQRDERLGWTGDAQVFVKAASYNYDVRKFFRKWLHDMAADQGADGKIGHVIPDVLKAPQASAAWGDAATVCPWQIYQTYADKEILKDAFPMMKKYVDYITKSTKDKYLWTGGEHYADWLGLDAPSGSYKGSTREDFIASAFYAYSTANVIKAGKVLGEDVAKYEKLHAKIVETFRKTYPEYLTQTEHILAVKFGLAEDPAKTAKALNDMVKKDGQMRTGFVGTPYLLHVLSEYGYSNTAYDLMLREAYPSWLYPVTKGATTIWEHWDGIMEDGGFWSADMNSFNHYAYGCAIDWIYEVAAGIRHEEDAPGFKKVIVAPHPSKKLGWLDVSLETKAGRISSKWVTEGRKVRYDIVLPTDGCVIIDGTVRELPAGQYTFYGKC